MGLFSDQERLLRLQRQLTVIALLAFIVYVFLQVSGFFADLLRILLLSLLVSYLVINIVDALDRWLRNRALAVALVYVALLALIVVSAFFIIPAIVYQIASLISATVDNLPSLLKHVNDSLMPLQQRLRDHSIDVKVIDVITAFVAQLPKPDPGAVITRLTDVAMGTMTGAVYSASIAVVTFYFLFEGHLIKDRVVALFPVGHREHLQNMAHHMDQSLQSFFRGQLILGVGFGLVMLGIYLLLGIEYSLLLAAFLGICEILPVIGPPLGFAPALVAVAIHGSTIPGNRIVQMICLSIIFIVLQQVKDSVVAPRYIGNAIGMHPLIILIAIMVGARIDGAIGVILSLPVACILNVLIEHLALIAQDKDDEHHAVKTAVAAEVEPATPKSG